MIEAGNIRINPQYVVSMEWEHRHYMSGPGESTLIVHMTGDRTYRIKHEAHYLNGVDAYEVERQITARINGKQES